jgi:hypothetical protein
MFADMPAEPLQAVAWIEAHVDHVDSQTVTIRERLEASSDPGERGFLERELMFALWIRGAGLERAWEILIQAAPDRAAELEPLLGEARAQQQVARQRLWGDPSAQ